MEETLDNCHKSKSTVKCKHKQNITTKLTEPDVKIKFEN